METISEIENIEGRDFNSTLRLHMSFPQTAWASHEPESDAGRSGGDVLSLNA